jgi:hypothetical protein
LWEERDDKTLVGYQREGEGEEEGGGGNEEPERRKERNGSREECEISPWLQVHRQIPHHGSC